MPKPRGRGSSPKIQKASGDAPQGYSWCPLLLLAPPRSDPYVLWDKRTQEYPCHENVENTVKETEDVRVPLAQRDRMLNNERLHLTEQWRGCTGTLATDTPENTRKSSYWPDREKTISLRPLSLKKNSGLAIRSACKVL